jgi:hypothetical protein
LSSRLLSKNVKIKIYNATVLLVAKYECKTWSLAVRAEHRVGMYENRVLRKIFGPKRDEVSAIWRNVDNEDLHNLYSSLNIIRIISSWWMIWEGHVARI